MLNDMLPCRLSLRGLAVIAMLTLAGQWLHPRPAIAETAPAIVVNGLGTGTFVLSGPWQFHPGDDPAWASPSFDSSKWERISADRSWGYQGHAQLTGYAWYRCEIVLTSAPGNLPQFSLLMPRVDSAYEIYWNGSLVGRNGRLQPRPVWFISQPMQPFALGQAQHGVLAVRIWKSPLLSDDSGVEGGFASAPLIGSPEAIATAQAAYEYQWLNGQLFHLGENLLCAVLALLSLLLWLRARSRWVLFWTAGFAISPPAILLLLSAHMGWPYPLAMGAAQPLSAIQDVSLWFLLVWLLHLHEDRAISRLTRILASICMVNACVDGVLVAISWNPRWIAFTKASDAVSAVVSVVLEAFPLVLVSYALLRRKRLDSARWLLAILSFLDEMIMVFRNAVKQGRQFTDWSIATSMDRPLFTIHGSAVSLYTISGILLLVAIVYAVYHSVREDQRRQDALEREKAELMHESKQMRHEAEHDGLTGLWNHRMIVERLGEEMSRSLRQNLPLSVVLIDVDYFKQVNDSFGHLAGDIVLKEMGTIFTRSLRPYDSVGRYGGEEFLLILPDCEVESAMIRAEQLRMAVQSARIVDGETTLQVTASFGVALAFPTYGEAESVIRAADAALYRAKSTGRNCVMQTEAAVPLCES